MEARRAGPAGKETYYQRWRRLHPKVTFYLRKETYERLKEAAASRNMTVKDFVLSLIEGFEKSYEEARGRGFEEGYARALEDFINDPWLFREEVRRRHPKMDVALFEVPCPICKKPMVFNHRLRNWQAKVKPELLEAFKHWHHVDCEERGPSALRLLSANYVARAGGWGGRAGGLWAGGRGACLSPARIFRAEALRSLLQALLSMPAGPSVFQK